MASEFEILSTYIREEIGYQGPLDPDVDLLEAKILDSFNIVEMAMFMQQRFDVTFEAEDLVRANLATLANMLALIGRCKGIAIGQPAGMQKNR